MTAYPNLVQAMAVEGISQEDIAKLLGIHRNTVSGKINGSIKSGFYIEEVLKLLDFGLKKYDMRWLFTRYEVQSSA